VTVGWNDLLRAERTTTIQIRTFADFFFFICFEILLLKSSRWNATWAIRQ